MRKIYPFIYSIRNDYHEKVNEPLKKFRFVKLYELVVPFLLKPVVVIANVLS